MAIYYEIKPGTEAAEKLEQYLQSVRSGTDKIVAIAKGAGSTKPKEVLRCDSQCVGMRFPSKPDGWRDVKGYPGWYMPQRIKANKALLADIASCELGSAVKMACAMFGQSPIYFKGLSLIRGIGYDEVAGRHFIDFEDDGHVKLFTGKWPKGLKKIRESAVMRWREDHPEAPKKEKETEA